MADLVVPPEDAAPGPRAVVDGSDGDAADERALILDLDGYEGPLDVLLALARSQKVDLARISILALAEQYLAFVARARRVRLELAAEYLVMAAWLAYLKSRLLLPDEEVEADELSGTEMAEALALRLRRLEAMRDAAVALMDRPLLGRDVFLGGAPEGLSVHRQSVYQGKLYELLSAYAAHRTRRDKHRLLIEASSYYSMEDAYRRLGRMLGGAPDWESLSRFLPHDEGSAPVRSALASTLAASLELAREGRLQLRQLEPFGPIYIRRKQEET
jgi:segregation and condensation protein A